MEFTYQGMIRYGFGFCNPNYAAALIACLLPVCWSMRVFLKKRLPVYLAIAVEVLLYVGLILTYSRTGFIAVLIEGFIFLFLKNYFIHPEHPLRLRHFLPRGEFAVLAVAGLIVFALSCGFLMRCFHWISVPDRSVTNRFTVFRGGLRMLADNPDGVGSGMSGMIYTTFYQPVEAATQYGTMVNSFLTFAVENGILRAYAVALGFILPVAAAMILLRKHRLCGWKSILLLAGVCILAGCTVSGMGSSCFNVNVLGSDPGFINELDHYLRMLLLLCPAIAAIMLLGVVISEHRRLYNHAGLLLTMIAVFMLSGGIGLLLTGSLYKDSAGAYEVLKINGGKWLKYIPGDCNRETCSIIVIGPGGSWDLKRIADFVKKSFPKNNILIPLNNTADVNSISHPSKIILCGKNYLLSEKFPDAEQYWLLPEGPPPEKIPASLKKIYLSRYNESGYNSLWKNRPSIVSLPVEEID